MSLTQKQSKVLQFICNFFKNHHYCPSYKDIAKHFNFSSDGTVRMQKSDEGMGGRGIKIGLRRKKQDKDTNKPARPGGATGNLYQMRQTKKGEPAVETQVLQLPEVIWVTVEDGSS